MAGKIKKAKYKIEMIGSTPVMTLYEELAPHRIKRVKPYILRDYVGKDFSKKSEIFISDCCAVCGHHIPRDQCLLVDEELVHNDVRICLALTLKSGNKL